MRKWLTEEDEDEGEDYNVSSKWRELGMALGLKDNVLSEIEEARGNAARLDKVMNHWLQNCRPVDKCNWLTLIEALKGGIVQKTITADHVEDRLREEDTFERYQEYKK